MNYYEKQRNNNNNNNNTIDKQTCYKYWCRSQDLCHKLAGFFRLGCTRLWMINFALFTNYYLLQIDSSPENWAQRSKIILNSSCTTQLKNNAYCVDGIGYLLRYSLTILLCFLSSKKNKKTIYKILCKKNENPRNKYVCRYE